MKFRYYITDTFEGSVRGTNKLSVAEHMALMEEYFVVDTETGEWLQTNDDRVVVRELNVEEE